MGPLGICFLRASTPPLREALDETESEGNTSGPVVAPDIDAVAAAEKAVAAAENAAEGLEWDDHEVGGRGGSAPYR